MSGKLGEIEAHLASAHQLGAVIGAMRGIAASRAHEARGRLAGIRASAATVGRAIGAVLPAAPPQPRDAPARAQPAHRAHLKIVFGSEQGFVGAFNERLLDHASRAADAAPREYIVIGSRALGAAQERGLQPVWSAPMASHTDHIVALAADVTQALYERIERASVTRVTLVHAGAAPDGHTQIVERTLVPFDFARFAVAPRALPPLVTLAPSRLLAGLAETYVSVELCEAAMLSFAAENEARMQAMMVAGEHMKDKLAELVQHYRRVRQDEITAEIVELAAAPPPAERENRAHADGGAA